MTDKDQGGPAEKMGDIESSATKKQLEMLRDHLDLEEKEIVGGNQARLLSESHNMGRYGEEPRRGNFSLNPKDRALLMTAAIQKITAPFQKATGYYSQEEADYESRENYGFKYSREEQASDPNYSHSKSSIAVSDFTFGRRNPDSEVYNSGGLGKRAPEGISPLDYTPAQFEKYDSRPPKFALSQFDSREYHQESMPSHRQPSYYPSKSEMKPRVWDTRSEQRGHRPASKPPVIKEGDWQCDQCGNVNWARRLACHL